MKRLIILLLCGLLYAAPTWAQEHVTLTTPVTQTVDSYRVGAICFDRDAARIDVRLTDPDTGKQVFFKYEDALPLIRQVNKANNSTISMEKRIMNKLIADGKIDGSVSGVPD